MIPYIVLAICLLALTGMCLAAIHQRDAANARAELEAKNTERCLDAISRLRQGWRVIATRCEHTPAGSRWSFDIASTAPSPSLASREKTIERLFGVWEELTMQLEAEMTAPKPAPKSKKGRK